MRRLVMLVAVVGLSCAPAAFPKGSGGHGRHSSGSHHSKGSSTPKKVHVKAHDRAARSRCATCPRDRHGRIVRSPEARREFMRRSGYAHGRKGYVVDHIVALECGGRDAPSNMQWQTVAEARAKDRTETRCR